MFATERLWLTADRTKLVTEGDPTAATLYAAVGDEIPDEAAARLGLVDGALKHKGPKGGAPEGDKSRTPESDKGAKAKGGLTINKQQKG